LSLKEISKRSPLVGLGGHVRDRCWLGVDVRDTWIGCRCERDMLGLPVRDLLVFTLQ